MAECHWVSVAEDIIGHPIKEQQKNVLDKLLDRRHVFAAFPTGYGKSAIFGTFPAIYKHLHPEEPAPIALVISPLNSLSSNHVLSWTERGVKSVVLKPLNEMEGATVEGVKNGEYSLIFASPEIVHKDLWWDTFKELRRHIRLLVIDEAHTLTTWGTTFRPEFLKVGQLRGILPGAVTLALTATATNQLIRDVSIRLGLEDRMSIISLSPDRPEIFLKFLFVEKDVPASLSWYADLIKEKQEEAPRAIIYTRTISGVIRLYYWLDSYLGERAIKEGSEDDVDGRFVEMFHGSTDSESQERIIMNFRQTDSALRCVVATIAFGLGVDIANIRYILHWGPAKTVLGYWQETGRCSRDRQPGQAITYVYKGSNDKEIKPCMKSVLSSLTNAQVCIRARQSRLLLYHSPIGSGYLNKPLPFTPDLLSCYSFTSTI